MRSLRCFCSLGFGVHRAKIPHNHCGRCRIIFCCVSLCLGRPCSTTVGAWVNSAQSLWPLPAFVCVVFGVMVQRDFVGAWVNSAKSFAAAAGFCLCCVWGGCSDFVCVVNSAQSLQPLPAFCLCCVWGDGSTRLVGVWVNSAKSLRPLPAFVCVVFGLMV